MSLLSTWTLVHRRGCGGVAFHIEEHSIAGASQPIVFAVLKDGTRPKPDDVMVCESCGHRIGRRDLRFEALAHGRGPH